MRKTQFSFSEREIKDLVLSWALISLAFAIAFRSDPLWMVFVLSAVTVGIGFVLHELAHKWVAHYYGCHAEFKANKSMLGFAVITSFFGFVFAAPGAVWIRGHITKKQNGLISAAGPATNVALGVVFLLLGPVLGALASYGVWINAYLAVFNMLPLPGLDGSKVLRWSKLWYGVLLGVSGLLMLVSYL